MLLLVLWEELDSPLELDVLAEGAVLSLPEVPCEVLSEADVDPEEAPDEDELPELEELEDELLLDVFELDDSLLTVKVSVLLFTVQSL